MYCGIKLQNITKEVTVTLGDSLSIANIANLQCFMTLGMSLTYIRNSVGPRRDPWATLTPDLTTFQLEEEPFTTTRCPGGGGGGTSVNFG